MTYTHQGPQEPSDGIALPRYVPLNAVPIYSSITKCNKVCENSSASDDICHQKSDPTLLPECMILKNQHAAKREHFKQILAIFQRYGSHITSHAS